MGRWTFLDIVLGLRHSFLCIERMNFRPNLFIILISCVVAGLCLIYATLFLVNGPISQILDRASTK